MWEIFGDFNEGEILFLGPWGSWLIVLVGLGSVLILALSYADLKDMLPRRRAWTLLFARALVLCWAMIMLLEPSLELRAVSKTRNHIAILMDGSRSMEVQNPDGKTRFERGQELLSQIEEQRPALEEDHLLEHFSFAEETHRSSLSALLKNPQAEKAEGSRLQRALDEVAETYGRNELGGILLISDGIDSGALGGRNPEGSELDLETLESLRRLGAPLHVLAVTPSSGLRDVSVEEVQYDDFAFVHNRMAIDATLRGLGVSDESIEVELWRDGEKIRTRSVLFQGDDDQQEVSFELIPEMLGKSVFSVRIVPLKDEATEKNNSTHFIIKVIRDKIRVLQVCGRPSTDERFLRRFLKENPNVDLISFFILRTGANLHAVPPKEMSLIPFPQDELFDDQLHSFDLVIFQNFNYGPYVPSHYLKRIEEFVVDHGGAFLMMGGDLSFSHGGYEDTPVGKILPIELRALGGGSMLLSEAHFRPELTPAGQRHPISRLAFDPVQNAARWSELPPLEGSNLVGKAVEGATVLATHPILKDAAGEAMPMIAVRSVGKGRTMSFTSDSSWFWSLLNAGEGGTALPYNTFWNNAIRWLIHDPALKLIKVEIEDEQLAPGDTLRSQIKVLEADYAPAVGASGILTLKRRPLSRKGPSLDETQLLELPFIADAGGQFTFEYPISELGIYSIEARLVRGEETLEDHDLFLVTQSSKELQHIAPRDTLLHQLAEATGGTFVEIPATQEVLAGLPFNAPKIVHVQRRHLISLWDAWWAFLVLAFFLGGEWLLRRRWGRL